MKINNGFQPLSNLFAEREKMVKKKPPAHEWQDLALRVLNEINAPNFKRGAVFKICKENSKEAVERALNDTKELCQTGQKWSYFFKIIDNYQFGDKNKKASDKKTTG